jgi:hypothetical protein
LLLDAAAGGTEINPPPNEAAMRIYQEKRHSKWWLVTAATVTFLATLALYWGSAYGS